MLGEILAFFGYMVLIILRYIALTGFDTFSVSCLIGFRKCTWGLLHILPILLLIATMLSFVWVSFTLIGLLLLVGIKCTSIIHDWLGNRIDMIQRREGLRLFLSRWEGMPVDELQDMLRMRILFDREGSPPPAEILEAYRILTEPLQQESPPFSFPPMHPTPRNIQRPPWSAGGTCQACMENVAEYTFYPCMHTCLCEECMKKNRTNKCPLCRAGIHYLLPPVSPPVLPV